jgi:hypothetical protein
MPAEAPTAVPKGSAKEGSTSIEVTYINMDGSVS